MKEIYLDNSATTKPFDEILEGLKSKMGFCYGNPSSLHAKGLESEKILKQSKQIIADSLGAASGEIFFTAGGTESNNIALQGYVKANEKRLGWLVTSEIEHPSVKDVFRYFEKSGLKVRYIPVDSNGVLKVDEFEKFCQTEKVSLVSIMHVNNEVGSVQPIEEIIKLKKQYNFNLHIDAVQSYCKLKLSGLASNIELLSMSGHKIHALKGIGALYISKRIRIEPLYFGGGQESEIRPGTENIPGIWSIGKAVEIFEKYGPQALDKTRELKEYFIERVLNEINDTGINGLIDAQKSVPHIANIWFKGIPGEVMLHALEEKGIYTSTGSACSSRKKTVSHVLKAMGIKDDIAGSSVRFSLSILNTKEEIDYVIEKVSECVKYLRR